MPKPKKGNRLGAGPSDQKKILSNLAKSLIEHGSITTTFSRAKTLQPYVEKLITKAKKGDIHNRRLVTRHIGTKTAKSEREFDAVYELFDRVVPALDPQREGGYTRVVRVGNRRGDNAPMATISLIYDKVEKKAVIKDAEATAKRAAQEAKREASDDEVQDGVTKPAERADDKASGDATPGGEAPQVGGTDAESAEDSAVDGEATEDNVADKA